jgi:hypothetical protein
MRRVSALGEIQRIAASPAPLRAALAVTGFFVWAGLSFLGGNGEAWDNEAYLYVGVPVMALAVAAAGFLNPERPWRWALWLVGGHQLGMLLLGLGMQSGFSLLILTLALGALLAVGFALPAFVGAEAARRLAERAY